VQAGPFPDALNPASGTFYYHPEWINGPCEPSITVSRLWLMPCRDRIGITLQELGGFVWFQITLAIVSLRIALSVLAAASAVTAALITGRPAQ
jgi:hypothetical protein